VEDSAEQVCSQVATVDRLLQEVLAMFGRDILHPIRVSLEKKNSLPEFVWLLEVHYTPLLLFLQCLARRTIDMPRLSDEVIQVRKAARVMSVHAVKEVAAAWESTMTLVKDGGLVEGVEDGGRECHDIGLCSRGGRGARSEDCPSLG
jgi:hypothetical protein